MAAEITQLLGRWRAGDGEALDQLLPLVYDHLRVIAGRCMRGEDLSHTLSSTALVHEAYLRLAGASTTFEDRAHFFAVAARVMRRILVDHARAHRAQKRGGDALEVTLDEAAVVSPEPSPMLLALDHALDQLQAFDPRKASLIEMVYFGGMTLVEAGEVLSISQATIHRDLAFSKAWLQRAMNGTAA